MGEELVSSKSHSITSSSLTFLSSSPSALLSRGPASEPLLPSGAPTWEVFPSSSYFQLSAGFLEPSQAL